LILNYKGKSKYTASKQKEKKVIPTTPGPEKSKDTPSRSRTKENKNTDLEAQEGGVICELKENQVRKIKNPPHAVRQRGYSGGLTIQGTRG